jgi:hypothetical protein
MEPEPIFPGEPVCKNQPETWPTYNDSGEWYVYGSWTAPSLERGWAVVADIRTFNPLGTPGQMSLLCTLGDGCISTSTAVTDAKYWDL